MKKTFGVLLLFLGAAILSTGISVGPSRADDAPGITVAYTSNLRGYLEPCG
jgi:hypothetical protein